MMVATQREAEWFACAPPPSFPTSADSKYGNIATQKDWTLDGRFGSCVTSTVMSTTVRNCTRDEGGPFEAGSQVLVSSHRKLLSSTAMVVSVAETPGQDSVRQG
jgi:hypothetical protein